MPSDIAVTGDLEWAVRDAAAVILVVPSPAIRSVARKLHGLIRPAVPIVNAAKGLEKGTLLRLSQVIAEELPGQPIAVLSGPSHAERCV